MSHFTVVEIEATDASCLIEALEALGYRGKIEVQERQVTLIGYDDRPRLLDEQEVRAAVVIRRQNLWEAGEQVLLGMVMRTSQARAVRWRALHRASHLLHFS